jgi:hypothetical protein
MNRLTHLRRRLSMRKREYRSPLTVNDVARFCHPWARHAWNYLRFPGKPCFAGLNSVKTHFCGTGRDYAHCARSGVICRSSRTERGTQVSPLRCVLSRNRLQIPRLRSG